jgi:hypothetical protein
VELDQHQAAVVSGASLSFPCYGLGIILRRCVIYEPAWRAISVALVTRRLSRELVIA